MSVPPLTPAQSEALSFYESEIAIYLKKKKKFSEREFYDHTLKISESFMQEHAKTAKTIGDFPTFHIRTTENTIPAMVFYLGFTAFLKNIPGAELAVSEPDISVANQSIEAFKYKGHNRLDIKETTQAFSLLLD